MAGPRRREKAVFIRRKLTRGRIGKTKTKVSCATLPVPDGLLDILMDWMEMTGD
jgi:hypothetical protein